MKWATSTAHVHCPTNSEIIDIPMTLKKAKTIGDPNNHGG